MLSIKELGNNMKSVFLLEHVHVITEDNIDVKTIAIYSSEKNALDAIERLKNQPGFLDYPKLLDPTKDDEESGFCLGEYELGKDHWAEGYATV